jgi:hypothetical protein
MVALNFQPQFADDVADGTKCQTIRRTARCKAGDRIQLYTAQRTKACRKLGEATCKRVRPVRICDTEMWLDGRRLYAGNGSPDEWLECDNDFAVKDGFPGFMEMAEWFRDRYGSLPFEGFVIEWVND